MTFVKTNRAFDVNRNNVPTKTSSFHNLVNQMISDDEELGPAILYLFNLPKGSSEFQLARVFPTATRIHVPVEDGPGMVYFRSGIQAASAAREMCPQNMMVNGQRFAISTAPVRVPNGPNGFKYVGRSRYPLPSLSSDPAFLYILNVPPKTTSQDVGNLFEGARKIKIQGNVAIAEFSHGLAAAKGLRKPSGKFLNNQKLVISIRRPLDIKPTKEVKICKMGPTKKEQELRLLQEHILSKNLIKNPSGQKSFQNWTILENGGDGWIVESPPVHVPFLPKDSNFAEAGKRSAFVTSYDWCSMEQRIDLWEELLFPGVMKSLIPFEFVCSDMMCARSDCEGRYRLQAFLEEKPGGSSFHMNQREGLCDSTSGWKKISLSIRITDDRDVDKYRYLVFQHAGRDTRYWKGHYGVKFSRASVQIKCLPIYVPVPIVKIGDTPSVSSVKSTNSLKSVKAKKSKSKVHLAV